MGEFNSDDHYIYYCGQEPLRRNGIALIISLKCTIWVPPQKWQNDLDSFPRQIVQHHSNSSLYPNHWCQRSWNWSVLWRPTKPTRPTRSNSKKDILFIIGDWNVKVVSQEVPGVRGKFGSGVQNEEVLLYKTARKRKSSETSS